MDEVFEEVPVTVKQEPAGLWCERHKTSGHTEGAFACHVWEQATQRAVNIIDMHRGRWSNAGGFHNFTTAAGLLADAVRSGKYDE